MKGGVVGPHTRVMAHTGPQSFPRTPCWRHQGPSGRTSRHISVCAGTPRPGARRLPTGEHRDPNTWGTATASEVGLRPEGRRLTPPLALQVPCLPPPKCFFNRLLQPLEPLPGHIRAAPVRERTGPGTARGQRGWAAQSAAGGTLLPNLVPQGLCRRPLARGCPRIRRQSRPPGQDSMRLWFRLRLQTQGTKRPSRMSGPCLAAGPRASPRPPSDLRLQPPPPAVPKAHDMTPTCQARGRGQGEQAGVSLYAK